MDCVNHNGVVALYYCQNCGKPLCVECIVTGALGHGQLGRILCRNCIASWQQSYQSPQAAPFVTPVSRGPNPSVAAALGVIPGVGAMYNGQFIKGLVHVVIFAVLICAAHLYGIFGLFIAAWILYQSFEAYHTARAIREGLPMPDPLGLGELGNRLNPGGWAPYAGQPDAVPPVADQQPPAAGGFVSPVGQPVPPNQSFCGPGSAPIGAIVLIGLGVLFLLRQLDFFVGRIFEFTWPLALIALGVWLITRRLGGSQGGWK